MSDNKEEKPVQVEGDVSRVESVEDEEDEDIITMQDVLDDEEELESEAFALLGASDDKNCSYLQGYVYRQALYSCMTCKDESSEGGKDAQPAGVCLACTYSCHSGHNLVELYTKRNFRCDCGNSKFPRACKLIPNRELVNDKNTYNQNFVGTYCTCARPYPDPENPNEEEMIQCGLCEDWFHKNHLDVEMSAIPDEYGEMICQLCVPKAQFLANYAIKTVPKDESSVKSQEKESTAETHGIKRPWEDETKPDDKESKKMKSDEETKNELASTSSSVGTDKDQVIVAKEEVDSGIDSKSCSPLPLECTLPKAQVDPDRRGGIFLANNWRKSLCKCTSCVSLYKAAGIEFILDPTDDMPYYIEQSHTKGIKTTAYDKGMSELSKLDRVQQIEALSSYNSLKGDLKEFLKKFAEEGKVVRKEDIEGFFASMEEKRGGGSGGPSFIPPACR